MYCILESFARFSAHNFSDSANSQSFHFAKCSPLNETMLLLNKITFLTAKSLILNNIYIYNIYMLHKGSQVGRVWHAGLVFTPGGEGLACWTCVHTKWGGSSVLDLCSHQVGRV